MSNAPKKKILVIGGGAVGAIAALNLEVGGLAEVTLVLRSNYNAVRSWGYTIQSCDHGTLKGWKPSHIIPSVPTASSSGTRYDYIVLTTKNIPDIPPTISELLSPILSPENTKTCVVLIQNGLNIEIPLMRKYPTTPVLSGVSLIGSAEPAAGIVVQDDRDRLLIGAFSNPNSQIDVTVAQRLAQEFVTLYAAGGKTECLFSEDVRKDRWRKLVYNAVLNPICAVTGLDTGRVRLADGVVEGLVRPAMREIVEAARARGVVLEEGVVERMIGIDPLEVYLVPSMLADVRKGNFIEFENLIGEPLREGEGAGVQMPTVRVLYQIAKAVQWRIREERGLVVVPPKRGGAEH